MARIDIEIEDYLYEVDTKYLVKELAKRRDLKDHKAELKNIPQDWDLPEFKTQEELLNYIKRVLHLKPWHGKDRIIKEIQEL